MFQYYGRYLYLTDRAKSMENESLEEKTNSPTKNKPTSKLSNLQGKAIDGFTFPNSGLLMV